MLPISPACLGSSGSSVPRTAAPWCPARVHASSTEGPWRGSTSAPAKLSRRVRSADLAAPLRGRKAARTLRGVHTPPRALVSTRPRPCSGGVVQRARLARSSALPRPRPPRSGPDQAARRGRHDQDAYRRAAAIAAGSWAVKYARRRKKLVPGQASARSGCSGSPPHDGALAVRVIITVARVRRLPFAAKIRARVARAARERRRRPRRFRRRCRAALPPPSA